MLAPTHSVFGLFLTLILLAMFGVQEGLHWAILAVAIFGSIAPDVDLSRSIIGRLFWFISTPIERYFGHRTVTHSLIGWGTASVLFGLVAASLFYLLDASHLTPTIANFLDVPQSQATHHLLRVIAAFSIGYASHILLDMFNPRGVQLLWPNESRDVIPGNVKFRPNAGSKAEAVIFVAFSLLLILAFPLSNYGLMTSLRWLLATPEAAIEEFKTTHFRTYIEFEGILHDTREKISGKAEVLDAQNKKLIIYYIPTSHPRPTNNTNPKIQYTQASDIPTLTQPHPDPTPHILPSWTSGPAGQPRSDVTFSHLGPSVPDHGMILTLSDELTADIIASSVHTIKTTTPISTQKRTFLNQTQPKLIATLTDNELISGTITLPDGITVDIPNSSFKSISQSGSALTLHFASKAQLAALTLSKETRQHQKTLSDQLTRLTQKRDLLNRRLDALLHQKTDLTPLGQQILGNAKADERNAQLIDRLQVQLEQIDKDTLELQAKLLERTLLFSGNVVVRKV